MTIINSRNKQEWFYIQEVLHFVGDKLACN